MLLNQSPRQMGSGNGIHNRSGMLLLLWLMLLYFNPFRICGIDIHSCRSIIRFRDVIVVVTTTDINALRHPTMFVRFRR